MVGTFEGGPYGVGPSHTEGRLTRSPDRTSGTNRIGDIEGSKSHVIPHPCTACGSICYGPASDFRGDGLLQFVSKSHSLHSRFCFISQFSIVL